MDNPGDKTPGGGSTPAYKGTLKNVFFFTGGIVLFITGVIGYGIILNLRTVPLSRAMEIKGIKKFTDPKIIIDRRTYTLSLYDDTVLVKSYRASFGRNLNLGFHRRDNSATPVGNYKICRIDTSADYGIFLTLNYPNIEDMNEGLRKDIITQTQYDKLKYEFYYLGCPTLKTGLGNNIGIHGQGRLNFLLKNLPFVYNWTNGSVALSNENIEEISQVVKKGTEVVIK